MLFKKLNSPTTFVVQPGLPEDWNFLMIRAIDSPFKYQWIYGLVIFLLSVGSIALLAVYGNDSEGVVTLFVLGILAGFPLSIYWIKGEIEWKVDQRESSGTYKEPRILEEITLVDYPVDPDDLYTSTTFVYHHFKKGKYIGTVCFNEIPNMVDRTYSIGGSTELYVTCSACNTRSKCVTITNYYSGRLKNDLYWLGPHDNCSKFPHHPTYDVEAIFRHRSIRGNTKRISKLRYLDKEQLDFQQEIELWARGDES